MKKLKLIIYTLLFPDRKAYHPANNFHYFKTYYGSTKKMSDLSEINKVFIVIIGKTKYFKNI